MIDKSKIVLDNTIDIENQTTPFGKQYGGDIFIITDEDEVENLLVSSIINIHFTKDADKVMQPFEALTLLEDDETKEIISTEFRIEIK